MNVDVVAHGPVSLVLAKPESPRVTVMFHEPNNWGGAKHVSCDELLEPMIGHGVLTPRVTEGLMKPPPTRVRGKDESEGQLMAMSWAQPGGWIVEWLSQPWTCVVVVLLA